jgi:hypothetical protein
VYWNPDTGEIDREKLEGVNAVAHLAGENLAEGRWTEERKRRIRDSRIKGTEILSRCLASLHNRPEVLISASATGFYGNRGDEMLTEKSASGSDFLAELCRDWETATRPAAEAGIRVLNARFGVVLSAKGGALQRMLTPFKLGLGGQIGDGRQFVSWISLSDAVNALLFGLEERSLAGPVNIVAPDPVTNSELTSILGKQLSRPTIFSIPEFAMRLAFGEMADEVLLSSARVMPERLLERGFQFRFPTLASALKQAIQS